MQNKSTLQEASTVVFLIVLTVIILLYNIDFIIERVDKLILWFFKAQYRALRERQKKEIDKHLDSFEKNGRELREALRDFFENPEKYRTSDPEQAPKTDEDGNLVEEIGNRSNA